MTGINHLITWVKNCFCWIVHECYVSAGHRILTILGSGLGGQDNDSAVFVGTKECVTLQWTLTNITCELPVLPPGLHDVFVQIGNKGYPQTRYSYSKKSFSYWVIWKCCLWTHHLKWCWSYHELAVFFFFFDVHQGLTWSLVLLCTKFRCLNE